MNAKQDFPTSASDMTADQTVEAVREQSRQFTQQEVSYQQDAGDETKNCGLCYFWQGAGQCQVVGGEINRAGLSDLYISKEQQDAAMGEDEDMNKQNGKHETKAFSVGECKIIDEDQGVVEHLVAVMGNVDLGSDIIHPGAFTKTIAERGHKVKVVDSHNYGSAMDVVGKPIALWEVNRAGLPPDVLAEFPMASGGLMARTQFLLDTHKGSEIFTRIKAGAIDQYSIGYDPLDMDYTKITLDGEPRTVRNLRTIKLGEYSPVVFAMNEATATVSAKTKPVDDDGDEPSADNDTDELSEEKAGRMLSAANAGHISNALAALMSVLERAGIDVPGFGGDDEEDEDMAKGELLESDCTAPNLTIINVTTPDELAQIIKALPSHADVTINAPAPDKTEANALAEKQETPAPEKAADNEHQAGPQVAPTSDDDVLNRIKTLEAELELQEV